MQGRFFTAQKRRKKKNVESYSYFPSITGIYKLAPRRKDIHVKMLDVNVHMYLLRILVFYQTNSGQYHTKSYCVLKHSTPKFQARIGHIEILQQSRALLGEGVYPTFIILSTASNQKTYHHIER